MQAQPGVPPPSRRRVRSGCLTCRARRRKCDEGKPKCQNCRTRNVDCRYGLNITFVESRKPDPAKVGHPSMSDVAIQYRPEPQRQTFTTVSSSQENGASPRTRPSETQFIQNQVGDALRHAAIEPETTLSTSLPTSHTPFLNNFDPFNSASTAFPPLSSLLVSDHPWISTLDTPLSRPDTAKSSISPGDGGPHAIELFTLFRYDIAPRLDLGVGEPFFGVCALVRAKNCDALYQSILALSTSQKDLARGSCREVDDLTSGEYALRAMGSLSNAMQEDRTTALVLLTLRDIVRSPPGFWSEITLTLQRNTNVLATALQEGQWQMMARLILAATLTAPNSASRLDLSFVSECARPVSPGQMLTNKQQLRQALSNLARALMSLRNDAEWTLRTSLPMAAVWQSCWSDNELSYFGRNEEMQQVFEVDDSNPVATPSAASPPFPTIIFSNVCTLLANFTHHLTAIYLLHHKPRLIKPMAQPGWSASPVWHAQRLVGMVAAFNEAEIFDPLVVAGLIYVARKLSHPSQLAIVANILKKAARITGMQLQREIEKMGVTCEKVLG